jgi:hypothetical protein
MMWGRIPIVVGDYGIQAEQHTTNFFGCGAMHRLRDLGGLHKLQELPLVNQDWLEAMGGGHSGRSTPPIDLPRQP